MQWSGLYTALVTPFKAGKLDEAGLEQLLERQKVVDGLVLLGTTGEGSTLTLAEKTRILALAKKTLNIPLAVAVGAPSTQTTLDNATWAAEHGADALLVVPPYYNKPMQEGIYLHFEALAKHTTLPILIYNIPGRTGVNIEVATIQRLAQIPNIKGIKESSGSLPQIMDILAAIPRDDFVVLSGDDNLTLPMMTLGAHGVISVASNLLPEKMAAFIKAAHTDITEARRLHFELLPLFKALFCETNPIPLKAALTHLGLPSGDPRLPLTPLPLHKKEALATILESTLTTSV